MAGLVQVGLAAAFYQWYSAARHWVERPTAAARAHALRVVGIERTLGIFREASVQAAALPHPLLVQGAALYYGTAHFVMPVVALVTLYRRDRGRYVEWRNAFAVMSALAVVVFALWPVMPPRLLPASFHLSGVVAPGPDSSLIPGLNNAYAAMPSLHIAYACWSLLALWPVVRSRVVRGLLVLDPLLTLLAVVVTGNHYFLDAVGGVTVVLVGVAVARTLRRRSVTSARRVAVALLGASLVIWVPKGAHLTAALDVGLAASIAIAVSLTPGRRASPAPGTPSVAVLPAGVVPVATQARVAARHDDGVAGAGLDGLVAARADVAPAGLVGLDPTDLDVVVVGDVA